MKIQSHNANAYRPQFNPPSDPEPPQQGFADKFVPGAAAAVVGAGAGYLGAHMGAGAGIQLGILATPVDAGWERLVTNMVNGGRIGLVAGALSFGIVGGTLAYMAAQELMSGGEA